MSCVCCLLFMARRSALFLVCCLLFVVGCCYLMLLFNVYLSLFVACCWLLVVVGCCSLFLREKIRMHHVSVSKQKTRVLDIYVLFI